MPHIKEPAVVVFDAFGTLLKIARPHRPFSILSQHMAGMGVDVSDFAHRAMAKRHTLSSLAASYGAPVSIEFLAHLDGLLLDELASIEPYPEAERTLRYVLNRGASVVVASNLAWPYALPVCGLLSHMASEPPHRPNGRVSTCFSFDAGRLKPDPVFYHELQLQLQGAAGISPPAFFMVGDRLAEDVQGPVAAGWSAWHLDRPSGANLLDAPWDEWLRR